VLPPTGKLVFSALKDIAGNGVEGDESPPPPPPPPHEKIKRTGIRK
tara:strand:- start:147 stop:284 length:138 start_codon:yes stop_codon:yes gene_type:complete